MADELVVRDQIAEALYHSLRGGEHGLKAVPGLIRRAIEHQIWLERKIRQLRDKTEAFPNFAAFIEAPPPEGLGATHELIERMLKFDDETLLLFRRATVEGPGRPIENNDSVINNNVIIKPKPKQGNSRAYTLDRLQRERPDLFDKVKAGELSANAAAIEAGFRKRTTPLEQVLKIIVKLTRTELRQLRARIDQLLNESEGNRAA